MLITVIAIIAVVTARAWKRQQLRERCAGPTIAAFPWGSRVTG